MEAIFIKDIILVWFKWLDKVELITCAWWPYVILNYHKPFHHIRNLRRQPTKFNLCHVSMNFSLLSFNVLWHSKPLPSTYIHTDSCFRRVVIQSQIREREKNGRKDEDGHYEGWNQIVLMTLTLNFDLDDSSKICNLKKIDTWNPFENFKRRLFFLLLSLEGRSHRIEKSRWGK